MNRKINYSKIEEGLLEILELKSKKLEEAVNKGSMGEFMNAITEYNQIYAEAKKSSISGENLYDSIQGVLKILNKIPSMDTDNYWSL